MSMSVIDERGRVFGRINLIDAAAALLVFVLIPVAYGAYLLFRTPPARLTSIAPATIQHGPNQRVQIRGVNLRPFMRVAFGTNQGVTFSITSTTSAEIEVPELPPGSYDVVLYDYRQEVDRLPKALTVLTQSPVPQVTLDVQGSFKNIDAATAAQLHDGLTLATAETSAEVLHVGTLMPATVRLKVGPSLIALPIQGASQLPATVRVHCYTEVAADGALRCMVQGPHSTALVAPDSMLSLPGPRGWLSFQVDSAAFPATPPTVDVRVVFSGRADLLALVKAGDVDSEALAMSNALKAAVVGVTPVAGAAGAAVEGTLRVPAVFGGIGWLYNNQLLKPGLPFRFESASYVVQGQIVSIKAPAAPPK